MTVTVYVGVVMWSRGIIDSDGDDLERQPHAPHEALPAAADPVLAHRQVVAEVKAKHLQRRPNRTGWEHYFRYQAIGNHVWPTTSNERDDRILNQLHLTHQDPAGQFFVYSQVPLYPGNIIVYISGSWNRKLTAQRAGFFKSDYNTSV